MLDSGQNNCFVLSPIFRSWKTSFQSWKNFVGTFFSVLRKEESGQNAWLLWKVCSITPPSFSGKDRLLGRNVMQLVMYELPAEWDQSGCESQWHFLRKDEENPPPWCPVLQDLWTGACELCPEWEAGRVQHGCCDVFVLLEL